MFSLYLPGKILNQDNTNRLTPHTISLFVSVSLNEKGLLLLFPYAEGIGPGGRYFVGRRTAKTNAYSMPVQEQPGLDSG